MHSMHYLHHTHIMHHLQILLRGPCVFHVCTSILAYNNYSIAQGMEVRTAAIRFKLETRHGILVGLPCCDQQSILHSLLEIDLV